ncbi:MAG: HNH endonuclease [Bacteroidota bacterium]
MDVDIQIRLAVFNWLRDKKDKFGDVLDRKILEKGFEFKGHKITLVGQRGIWKPKVMDLPISITTVPDGPYNDEIRKDDYLYYRYQGNDPARYDNVWLRECMKNDIPLVYFRGLIPGRYYAAWPMYIVDDFPQDLTFKVAADNQYETTAETEFAKASESRRAYITANVKQRLHQRGFRERVMKAYQSQCAFCRLKHIELLDAAHIIPDSEEMGDASVNNGLSLCKIHHAAFDQHIIGVTPDYQIKVKEDVLREKDGPMLKHGIQELQDERLILPSSRTAYPDQEALDWRYQQFSSSY